MISFSKPSKAFLNPNPLPRLGKIMDASVSVIPVISVENGDVINGFTLHSSALIISRYLVGKDFVIEGKSDSQNDIWAVISKNPEFMSEQFEARALFDYHQACEALGYSPPGDFLISPGTVRVTEGYDPTQGKTVKGIAFAQLCNFITARPDGRLEIARGNNLVGYNGEIKFAEYVNREDITGLAGMVCYSEGQFSEKEFSLIDFIRAGASKEMIRHLTQKYYDALFRKNVDGTVKMLQDACRQKIIAVQPSLNIACYPAQPQNPSAVTITYNGLQFTISPTQNPNKKYPAEIALGVSFFTGRYSGE